VGGSRCRFSPPEFAVLHSGGDTVIRVALGCLITLMLISGVAAEPVQLTVNGQARTLLLMRPGEQGPRPTVIVLHGGNSGADEEAELSGFAKLGPPHGFAAVFPQAKAGYWNFFPPGKESGQYKRYFQRLGGLPDDVAFVKMIAAELIQKGVSDPKRIYLVGRSLGGVMALRLACVEAETFAAVGLLISTMPEVMGSECQPVKPMPMLIINGTDDRVLPYRGERSVSGDVLWSTPKLVAFFRKLNGCSELERQSLVPVKHASNIIIERSTGCPRAPVVLYSIVGGGHDVPVELNASQTFLDFFATR
jgi:polyhydroxybutyrate depolymerase